MFLIIKLAIFIYFSPHFYIPVVCQSLGSTAVLWIHTAREEWSPLIGLQHSLPQAQEVPKKAHCPLSTSPAQNPPNQHNGPPDKVGKNKQRGEERWNEWRVFTDRLNYPLFSLYSIVTFINFTQLTQHLILVNKFYFSKDAIN